MESKYVNIHQEFIDGCIAGDRKSQFEIYKLYYKAMYNTSLRIVNDSAEAEDIMQEAFLDAFRRLHSYNGEGSFGSWLKRIVINRSLDHLRKNREMVELNESHINIPEENDDISDEDIIYQVSEVRRVIAGMPEDYRVILSLILFEGYDHEEVSRMLNITNQLSRTRYSRARQKLLELLRKESFLNPVHIN